MITRKATTLREALKVLTPKPLEKPEELRDFYSSEPNQVRGDNKIAHINLDFLKPIKIIPTKLF